MKNSPSRFLFGGLIVFVGLALLLEQLGVGYGLGKLWPLLIVIWGLYMIFATKFTNILPGLLVLTVGLFLQIDSLLDLPFSIWNLWPVFIIFTGISILLGKKDRHTSSTESGYITSSAVFWGDEKYVKGEFKGANLTATFGGIKLDLQNATISENVNIDVNLLFGGIELILPDNVGVINNGIGIFGGISEKSGSKSNKEYEHFVTINGSAMFGGVDIK